MRVLRLLLPIALAALALGTPAASRAQVYVSLVAPPLMPDYVQPEVTVPNSIWTPGYWAWGPAGYYWVPGTYVTPPSTGLLWTPGYWGVNTGGSGYMWNNGYWGQNVGYYGGINYGGGYYGNGYYGGGWQGNVFRYNTAVTPVNTRYIRNVYVNRTVIVRNGNRYAYNGPGGVRMHPDARQITYAREHHYGLTAAQQAHINEARQDRNAYAKYNNGRPAETVVARPLSTTNRPPNFKPLTTTGTTTTNHATTTKPATNNNSAMKPATNNNSAMKPATHPAAKPQSNPAMKPAPQGKPAGKPPESKPASKPPPQKGPETKATHAPNVR
ncbi:MAG: hypothetical protein WB615_09035 [Candidatus Tumulicola sp.]